jgi:hypothetical protein
VPFAVPPDARKGSIHANTNLQIFSMISFILAVKLKKTRIFPFPTRRVQ